MYGIVLYTSVARCNIHSKMKCEGKLLTTKRKSAYAIR